MTSNAGVNTLKKQKTLGFATDSFEEDSEYEKMKENIMEELKRSFRPEFLNRIDDIIVFHEIKEEDLVKIVKLMLNSVTARLEAQEIYLNFNEEVTKHLAKKGFDPVYGARPLRRAITKAVEDRLSEEILKGTIQRGDSVDITVEENELRFNKSESQNDIA